MSDVLNGVAETMGEVIGGIYTPVCPGTMVRMNFDPIGHWVLLSIAQENLHPQCGFTLLVTTPSHVLV